MMTFLSWEDRPESLLSLLEVLREGELVDAASSAALVMVVGRGVPLMVWIVVIVLGAAVVWSEVVVPVLDESVVVVASELDVEVVESEVGVGLGESVVEVSVGVGEEDSLVLVSVAESVVDVSVGDAEALPEFKKLPTSETKALWPEVTATSDKEYSRKERLAIRIVGELATPRTRVRYRMYSSSSSSSSRGKESFWARVQARGRWYVCAVLSTSGYRIYPQYYNYSQVVERMTEKQCQ